jgi:hypothetical protein
MIKMGNYINPLDLRKILIDYFLGTTELFFIAFIIVLSFVAAKFQLPNHIFLILLVICSLIMAAILGQAKILLILMVIGFVAFKGVSKLLT